MTQNPAYQVEIDTATPAEWSEMVGLFSDASLYQTWPYGQTHWRSKELSHLVLRREGEVLGIAQLRIVGSATLGIGIAYLPWGPLCERRGRRLDVQVFRAMARALEEEYVGKRKLFLRVLPNAFVGSLRAEAIQSGFCGFTQETLADHNTYRTFVVDLAPSLDELRKRLDKKWRNQLSQSERNNLKVTAGTGIEEYRIFRSIYDQMRKRKTFGSTVDVTEFGRMQEQLPEPHRMRILICEASGRPVAGLVASAIGDSAIYLLGATSDDGLNSKGSYLLQWTIMDWLKKNGFRRYDLGGIDPEHNPGVYHFKKGLSGTDASHISPLLASNGTISSALVRAGLAMQRTLNGWVNTVSPMNSSE